MRDDFSSSSSPAPLFHQRLTCAYYCINSYGKGDLGIENYRMRPEPEKIKASTNQYEEGSTKENEQYPILSQLESEMEKEKERECTSSTEGSKEEKKLTWCQTNISNWMIIYNIKAQRTRGHEASMIRTHHSYYVRNESGHYLSYI